MLQKSAVGSADQKKARTNKVKLQLPLHLMMIPGVILVVLFCYIPMFGIVMAFQDYNPLLGFFKSPWLGFNNFTYMFSMPDTLQVVWNTLYIAILKIIGNLLVPIVVALSICRTFFRGSFWRLYLSIFCHRPPALSIRFWVILVWNQSIFWAIKNGFQSLWYLLISGKASDMALSFIWLRLLV